MKISCVCGDSDCQTALYVSASENLLSLLDKHGRESFLYTDANSLVRLIKTLKEQLVNLAS